MINFTRLLAEKPDVSKILLAPEKAGPVVVFNLTRRCNLNCRHCYLESEDKRYKDELSLETIKKAVDSFAKLKIPVLLLSGGEPLVRKDIFEIIEYAKSKEIRVALSTNGTLLTKNITERLKKAGIDYVGISIDAGRKLHDWFRRQKGAFDKSCQGIINCLEAGLKTGIRFTLNKINAAELPLVLELCLKEKIPRFCLYHLVYSGRGRALAEQDIDNAGRRAVIDFLLQKTLEINRQKCNLELLTVDNHADGIFIYNYLRKKNPKQAGKVLELLRIHGGCSAGSKIVDISPQGEVYACQFWQGKSLGNIREKDMFNIWLDQGNKLFCRLRAKGSYLKGRCSRCRFKAYCGGCRIRAEVIYKDLWQEDPCCYLREEEIG